MIGIMFLWMAGKEGLSKFDGKTFTNFYHIDKRDITTVYCVYADCNNKKMVRRIWETINNL